MELSYMTHGIKDVFRSKLIWIYGVRKSLLTNLVSDVFYLLFRSKERTMGSSSEYCSRPLANVFWCLNMNQRPLLSLCKREGQRLSVGIIYNYRSSLCAIQAINYVGELFLFETVAFLPGQVFKWIHENLEWNTLTVRLDRFPCVIEF